jgi:hypothetical protein
MVEQLLLKGVIAGSIYALIALGFSLIYHFHNLGNEQSTANTDHICAICNLRKICVI